MKKRLLSFMLAMMMIISLAPVMSVCAGSYGNMTEESFVAKISSLRNTFVHGKYWNGYNGYEKAGDKKCPESNRTCPKDCSCSCGQFYYGNAWIAGQCHGYALKLGNLIFGGNPNTWTKVYNTSNVYAGDIARLDNDSHTIFIYKVDADTIYYTDCNASGPCMVNWNGTMSRNALASRLSWIYHLSGNTLTGKTSFTPTVTVPSVSAATVNDGTYTFKNASSGYMMNVYGGNDANGTAVTTWQYDGTTDQRIRIAHAGGGKYYMYAVCSASGRVVDVLRGANTNDTIDDGDKIDIYAKGDDPAQLFYIVPVGDGKYVFELASKDNHVIAATSASTAASNGTQLELKAYNGSDYQKWKLCNTSGGEVDASIKSQYYLDLNGLLDGTSSNGITGYGTCDIYINGSCVANDVSDYYTQHTQGSTYEIKDIKAVTGHTYGGVGSGGISGTLNGNTTVVLKYTTNVYTISYSANGGSGAPSAQTKKHGASLTLSSTKPARTGYTFLGWATSASATSATYPSGASYTGNANATLYAVWSPNSYTISYNANGGSGAPPTQTKKHDATLTLSSEKPTRTGYTFLGWATSASATSATYPSGASFTSNSDTTLYAVWEQNAPQYDEKIDSFYAKIKQNDIGFDVYVENMDGKSHSMYIITAQYGKNMNLLEADIMNVNKSSAGGTYNYSVADNYGTYWAKVFIWEKGTLQPLAEAAIW